MAGRCPLWVALALLLHFTTLCRAEYGICNIPCCSLTPNCSDALLVDCDCPDLDSISLHQGDIPPSVQSIYITGSGQLTFQKYAFYDLPSLATLSVDLGYEGELNVDENGLALRASFDYFSLKIANALVVVFANSAFTGFWTDAARIKLQTVQNLHIQQNSFNFISRNAGPELVMDHIGTLHLAPYSLNAPIGNLEMSNVNMPKCLKGSFGGHISRMKMDHVRIDRVRTGCVKSFYMTKLSIRSSQIGIVESQGFSEKMHRLKIEDTTISKIERDGFLLKVTELCIESCQFDDLMTRGLSVSANKSINLEDIDIGNLQKYGLIGLQVQTKYAFLRKAMHIRNISIARVEKGSLAFSKHTKLHLTGHLNIPIPDPPICPTKIWAHYLVGKPKGAPLSDADKMVLSKVKHRWLCPDTSAGALRNSGSDRNGAGVPKTALEVLEDEWDNLTPFEHREANPRRTTPTPDFLYETEPDIFENPLGDDAMDAPETSHMTFTPVPAEMDFSEKPLTDIKITPPATAPMPKISQQIVTKDPQETGTPEAETGAPSGVNPTGDGSGSSSPSGNTRTLSTGWIVGIVVIVIVGGCGILTVIWRFRRSKAGKYNVVGQ